MKKLTIEIIGTNGVRYEEYIDIPISSNKSCNIAASLLRDVKAIIIKMISYFSESDTVFDFIVMLGTHNDSRIFDLLLEVSKEIENNVQENKTYTFDFEEQLQISFYLN